MIVDSFDNLPKLNSLLKPFQLALDFLVNQDLAALSIGKHTVLDDRIFASVNEYLSIDLSQGRWEAHRRYIDIQTLAFGQERIGVAPLSQMNIQVPYDPVKDILWLSGSGDFVTLLPGRFAIFLPTDVHMPNLSIASPVKVKKVVMKIDVSLLG